MQIEVRLLQDSLTTVVGGTLNVTVAIKNVGAVRQRVHSTQTELPFEYEIASASGERVVRLSVPAFRHATSRQGLRALSAQPYWLDPGKELHYQQDLAAISLAPLEPGRYRLTAHYPTFDGSRYSSAPVQLDVRAAAVQLSTQVVGQSGEHLGVAYTAALDRGTIGVFERESPAARPHLGIIRERGREASDAPIGGLALATEIDAPRDWRWLTWLNGSTLAGAICWGTELPVTLAPSSHELTSATLLERGFQWGDAEGLFLLLGEADGQSVLALARLTARTTPHFQRVPLGLLRPRQLTAGLWTDAPDSLEVVRAYEATAVSGALQTRVSAARLSLSNPTQFEHSRLLGSYPGRLLALAVAPLLTGANPVVDILVEVPPDPPDAPAMTSTAAAYVRAPLLGGATQQWRVPALPAWPDGSPRGVDEWAICGVAHSEAPVVVRAGDELWYLRAAQPEAHWLLLERRETGVRGHRVENFAVPNGQDDGSLLVTFFDAQGEWCVRALPTAAPAQDPSDSDLGEDLDD